VVVNAQCDLNDYFLIEPNTYSQEMCSSIPDDTYYVVYNVEAIKGEDQSFQVLLLNSTEYNNFVNQDPYTCTNACAANDTKPKVGNYSTPAAGAPWYLVIVPGSQSSSTLFWVFAAFEDNTAVTTTCGICLKIVAELVASPDCSDVCDALPPPFDLACDALFEVDSGLCAKIIGWITDGVSPAQICNTIGFCGSANDPCECGHCTEYTFGRCLSFPNSCPGGTGNPPLEINGEYGALERRDVPKFDVLYPDPKSADASLFEGVQIAHLKGSKLVSLSRIAQLTGEASDLGLCIDGKCELGTVGCCNSCL